MLWQRAPRLGRVPGRPRAMVTLVVLIPDDVCEILGAPLHGALDADSELGGGDARVDLYNSNARLARLRDKWILLTAHLECRAVGGARRLCNQGMNVEPHAKEARRKACQHATRRVAARVQVRPCIRDIEVRGGEHGHCWIPRRLLPVHLA
jgi:hypothetical protein